MKIHFVGIGGIGISGIASIYKQKGNYVQGSDEEMSEITEALRKQGIKVFIGHKKFNLLIGVRHVSDINLTLFPDMVVYSEAVPKNNPELQYAKKIGIKCLSGAEALAELSKDYFTIAVSGMHGKTTTASMLAQVLIKAGLDPTFVIGVKQGWRVGKSNYLVIEADDYKAKFLHYCPDILLLTNIEEEHMDYFQNLSHIFKVFTQYIGQVKSVIVANYDDKNVRQVLKKLKTQNSKLKITSQKLKVIFYSLGKNRRDAERLKKILWVPGKHNVSNALAVLKAARVLGISDKITLKALSEYRGVWRRFEESILKIKNYPPASAVSKALRAGKLKIISDYAHHPTEIKATLKAAKEKFKNKKIWLVFQPHQYQRTFYLFDRFVKVFRNNPVDRLIITDIYTVKGRESGTIKKKTSAQKLVKAINKKWAVYIPQKQLPYYITENISKDVILMIMGAGDIYKINSKFKMQNAK